MKERQRWRPEEDSLLRDYVKKYGPREWDLVSHRMNKTLNRDAKSCQERWKNYLKPGIKKGSLSEDEQRLVISLQEKYGNKWKKIAAEVPGRTAKRLGKWWEVFKEKEHKKSTDKTPTDSANLIAEGKYDHILETFAEKYMQNQKHFIPPANLTLSSIPVAMPSAPPPLGLNLPINAIPVPDFFHLPPPLHTPNTSSSVAAAPSRPPPPWMASLHDSATKSSVNSSYTSSESASPSSPSVTLSLSNSTPKSTVNLEFGKAAAREKFKAADNFAAAENSTIVQQISTFFQHCKELEERQQSWVTHKKEASWRLKRLQEQLDSEKTRRRREKIEEIESKVWALREEEKLYLDRLEKDYREQIARLHKDEEVRETRMMEMWTTKHIQLTKFFEQMVHRHSCKPYESKPFESR